MSRDRISPVQIYDILHYSWIYLGVLPIQKFESSKKYILEQEQISNTEMDLDCFDDEFISNEDSSDSNNNTESDTGSVSKLPEPSYLLARYLPLGATCLAAGFVKSIKAADNEIEVLTSFNLNKKQLDSVNLIIIGTGVPVPNGFLFENDSCPDFIPYRGHNVGETILPSVEKLKGVLFKRNIIDNIHVPKYLTKILKDFEAKTDNKTPKPTASTNNKPAAAAPAIQNMNHDDDDIIIL